MEIRIVIDKWVTRKLDNLIEINDLIEIIGDDGNILLHDGHQGEDEAEIEIYTSIHRILIYFKAG